MWCVLEPLRTSLTTKLGELSSPTVAFIGIHRKRQRHKMHRLKIFVRKSGQDREHTVVLGRFGSKVITLLVLLVVIAMVTTAIVFGYIVIGLVFTALLIAVVVALILGAFQSLRR